jgi:hypothetical protein
VTGPPTVPVSSSAPPPTPKGRAWLNRLLVLGGIAVSALAVVLLVLGLVAFSSASSARDDARRFAKERRSLAAIERATQGDIRTISSQGGAVGDEIDKLVSADNELVSGSNALTSLLEQADAKYNAGDESAAAADVDNHGRPILNVVQVLAGRENQALTEAHDAQHKLRQGL